MRIIGEQIGAYQLEYGPRGKASEELDEKN